LSTDSRLCLKGTISNFEEASNSKLTFVEYSPVDFGEFVYNN